MNITLDLDLILDLFSKEVVRLTRENIMLKAQIEALTRQKEGTPDGETD